MADTTENFSPYSNMLLVSRESTNNGERLFYYAVTQAPEEVRKLGLRPRRHLTVVSARFSVLISHNTVKAYDANLYQISTDSYRPATQEDLTEYYQRSLRQADTTLQQYSKLLYAPPNIEDPP